MSKINDLIKKLCPNGVEKVSLGSLMIRKKEKNYENSGIKTVYSVTKDNGIVKSDDLHNFNVYSSDLSNYYILRLNQYAYNPARLNIGSIARLKEDRPGLVSPMYIVFELDSSKIDYEYYDHLLFSNKVFNDMCSFVEQGARFRFDYKNWDKIIIDLPPLIVQKEIVRILNKFSELEAELEAELEERKNQYKFWCEKLCGGELEELNNKAKNNKLELKKISEVGTLTRGKRFVKADAVENGASCIHYGELYTHYGICAYETKSFIKEELANKLRFAEKGDVVIVGAGENNIDIGIGVAWLGDTKPAIHDACYIFKHSLNPKYVSYYLRTKLYHNQLKSWVSEGKICAVSAKGIGECIMPIPSLNEQKEIVKILDKFDILINDMSVGLPAEIELRRKQYEYYRNKLLSFEELSVSE